MKIIIEWELPKGEVSEWLKEHAWKACELETVPWVRIPPSPFYKNEQKFIFIKLAGYHSSYHSCGFDKFEMFKFGQ